MTYDEAADQVWRDNTFREKEDQEHFFRFFLDHVCLNCKQLEDKHVKGKCLFMETTYRPPVDGAKRYIAMQEAPPREMDVVEFWKSEL